jgi:hypothetical protein
MSLTLGKIFKYPTRVASYYFVFVPQPARKFSPQLWRINFGSKLAVVAELAPVAAIYHGKNYAPQTLSLIWHEIKLPEPGNQVGFGVPRSEFPFVLFEILDRFVHSATFAEIIRHRYHLILCVIIVIP